MKKTISEEIFRLHVNDRNITWKDIKHIEFQDDDVIDAGCDDGFYSENESWDPFNYFVVLRYRLETDKEYYERLKEEENDKEELKLRRYQNYIKLKQEFEP